MLTCLVLGTAATCCLSAKANGYFLTKDQFKERAEKYGFTLKDLQTMDCGPELYSKSEGLFYPAFYGKRPNGYCVTPNTRSERGSTQPLNHEKYMFKKLWETGATAPEYGFEKEFGDYLLNMTHSCIRRPKDSRKRFPLHRILNMRHKNNPLWIKAGRDPSEDLTNNYHNLMMTFICHLYVGEAQQTKRARELWPILSKALYEIAGSYWERRSPHVYGYGRSLLEIVEFINLMNESDNPSLYAQENWPTIDVCKACKIPSQQLDATQPESAIEDPTETDQTVFGKVVDSLFWWAKTK